jgi:hypothetical protein
MRTPTPPCLFIQTKISFFKNVEQEGKTGPVSGLVLWEEGGPRKRVVGGWRWCKYCVLMYKNGKMRPVETVPGTGGEVSKG